MRVSFATITTVDYGNKYVNLNCDNDDINPYNNGMEVNLADITVTVFPKPLPNEFTLRLPDKHARQYVSRS